MDRTNMFFLIVAAGAAWFIFNETQKARQQQQALQQRQALELRGTRLLPPIDYAEQIATGYI